MIRCHEDWHNESYVRLTLLCKEEKYYNEQTDKFVYNDIINEIANKTKNSQVIADYLIKKEDLVKEFYRETNNYFKNLTKDDHDGSKIARKPSIPSVRKYLKCLKHAAKNN